MTLTMDPALETAILKLAHDRGVAPEVLVLDAVRDRFGVVAPPETGQDEWERLILNVGTDCGVSLTDQDVSSEGLYE